MQPDLLDVLIDDWPDLVSGQSALVLGFSGGLDSMVLLDLLCRWRDERGGPALSAIHIHHGLSLQADVWADFCGQRCIERQVALQVVRVSLVRGGGRSLEAEARTARYAAYAACAEPLVVLAHHADDQQETLISQLLRGGGPRALAGMPAWREWQGKHIWRPLLKVGRKQLQSYAEQRGLAWVEDESNLDTAAYLRNFVRHDILPRLTARVPALASQLQRAAQRMHDAAEMADALAAIDLQAASTADGRLLASVVLSLSPVRQRYVLLAYLQRCEAKLPLPEALQEWLRQLAAAAAEPQLPLKNGVLFASQGMISFLPEITATADALPAVRIGEDRTLPGGRLLWLRRRHGFADEWHGRSLQLQWRQGGERMAAKVGRKPLKHYFQEAGVPACLREQWPLLFDAAGDLVAVPGAAVAYPLQSDGEGWWPQWLPTGMVKK